MDLVEEFVRFTDNIPSPELFRLWGGISAVAATMERRVWLTTSEGPVYPNLFIMLVAPPGVGKGPVIDRVTRLWRATKKLKVSPDNMTKASLLDVMVTSAKKIPTNGGAGLFEYSSLALHAEEFGVLVPAHDMEFLSVLIRLYNNPDSHSDEKRHSTSVEIIKPQLNLIVGSQPDFLSHLLPETAWGMGFMGRMVMIYATFGPTWDEFDFSRGRPDATNMILGMEKLTNRMGETYMTAEAIEGFRRWKSRNFDPQPKHSRLAPYIGKRNHLILKLMIVSSASRGSDMIELDDLERARDWLLPAEALMPDIFREMAHKSDIEVIRELGLFVWREWTATEKPVKSIKIYDFLLSKAPSERIPRIIEAALAGGYILKDQYGDYLPKPKLEMSQGET